MKVWTAEAVVRRLEQAALALQRKHEPGCWPKGYGSSWPDVVRNYWESARFTRAEPPRIQPTAIEIAEMDEALRWIAFIAEPLLGRIVWARALLHPVSEEHRYSWRAIAAMVGMDRVTVQRRHGKGIALIVAHLNNEPYLTRPTVNKNVIDKVATNAA